MKTKETVKRERVMSLYYFNKSTQRYALIAIFTDEKAYKFMVAQLPQLDTKYQYLYVMFKRGNKSYHKYVHPQITQL